MNVNKNVSGKPARGKCDSGWCCHLAFFQFSYFNLEIKNKFTSARLYSQNKSSQLLVVMIYLAFYKTWCQKCKIWPSMHQQSSEGISFMYFILFLRPACLPPSLSAGLSLHVTLNCKQLCNKRKKNNLYVFKEIRQGQRPLDTKSQKKEILIDMAPKEYCFDLYTVAMVAFTAYDAILSSSLIIYSYVCTDTHIQSQRRSHTKIWPDHWHPHMYSFALVPQN